MPYSNRLAVAILASLLPIAETQAQLTPTQIPLKLLSHAHDSPQTAVSVDHPLLSANGRFVVFSSRATNLVPDKPKEIADRNSGSDVFVYDIQCTRAELVSQAWDGSVPIRPGSTAAAGGSLGLRSAISGDGRYVAFVSTAVNLAANDLDSGNYPDVFLVDRNFPLGHSQRVKRISKARIGGRAEGTSSEPEISADGQFVVFTSTASNLTMDDPGSDTNIFLYSIATGDIELVSRRQNGTPAEGYSPRINADASRIAFLSTSSRMIGNFAGLPSVFIRDRLMGTIELGDRDFDGKPTEHGSGDMAISGDGGLITFENSSANVMPGLEYLARTYVRDEVTDTLAKIDSHPWQRDETPVNSATIDGSGRHIAFVGKVDGGIYRRDLISGATDLLNQDANGHIKPGTFPFISADGQRVAFLSSYAGLIPGITEAGSTAYLADFTGEDESACQIQTEL